MYITEMQSEIKKELMQFTENKKKIASNKHIIINNDDNQLAFIIFYFHNCRTSLCFILCYDLFFYLFVYAFFFGLVDFICWCLMLMMFFSSHLHMNQNWRKYELILDPRNKLCYSIGAKCYIYSDLMSCWDIFV